MLSMNKDGYDLLPSTPPYTEPALTRTNSKTHTYAIFVEGLVIGYGKVRVIEGLDMKVPTGSIYGLLGPSGCGKSTLLKVLLGRLTPEYGKVLSLGLPPGTAYHTVPGSAVGYAPQEAALYNDITINETFQFHGQLHGMSKENLESRKIWLCDFLDLPPLHRLVAQLSGGQNRRLSLAIALLHDPQLLVLDEPTVGVDPLLRSRIWQYLREVARSGVTVIVTTHYIEEARQADCVGLMRNGRLLDEGPPLSLMQKYRMGTLEDVFLALCKSDDSELNQNSLKIIDIHRDATPLPSYDLTNSTTSSPTTNTPTYSNVNEYHNQMTYNHSKATITPNSSPPCWSTSFASSISHTFAIAQRKSRQMVRNRKLLAFTLLTPAFQIFLFFIAVGPDPRNLNFAVVNKDVGLFNYNFGNMVVNNLKGDIFRLHNYSDLSEAIENVKLGREWGVIYIPQNFSRDMPMKFSVPDDPVVKYQTTLHLYLDMSNYQITILVEQQILQAFQDMMGTFNITISPIEIDEAVYGSSDVKFKNFLAPGMIALICFAHSIAITAVAFVREKNDGTMDRIFAAGVDSKSIIAGHYLISNAVLLVQTAMLLSISVFIFEVAIEGNIGWVIVILLALGGVGMSLGLVISGAANIETEAVQLSLSAYFPALLMSGVIWPVEAIPPWISWLSLALPTTWAASALRSVMIRGWGITNQQVWWSIVIIIAWGICLITIAAIILQASRIKIWFKKKILQGAIHRAAVYKN